MNILTLQSDYPVLSLTRLSAPVEVVEVPILSVQVVEGMVGFLEEEPEQFEGSLVTEEVLEATVMEEEIPLADLEDEEPMYGVMVIEDTLEGVLED